MSILSGINNLIVSGNLTLQTQTASRALVFDSNKNLVSSSITSTELDYMSGVTSPIQTQFTGTVKTTGDQSISGIKTFSSNIVGNVTGNAGTVTNGVYASGNQTIGGTKTFSSTIVGSITGNAGTADHATTADTAHSATSSDNVNLDYTGIGLGYPLIFTTSPGNGEKPLLLHNECVYNPANNSIAANLHKSTDDISIIADVGRGVYFYSGGFLRFYIGSGGTLQPSGDDTNSIGSSPNRIKLVRAVTVTQGFTGGHFYTAASGYLPEIGDALRLVNREIIKCTQEKDPTCIGIYSGYCETTYSGQQYVEDSFEMKHYRNIDLEIEKTIYYIIALGDTSREGIVSAKVCNENGNINDGDLLCTASGYPGYLKKQDDDLVHSYTVGQARENITFSSSPLVSGVYVYILK